MNTKASLSFRHCNVFTTYISLLSPMAMMTSYVDLTLQVVKLRGREF